VVWFDGPFDPADAPVPTTRGGGGGFGGVRGELDQLAPER
jgi:hypothetical protein